jgi:hypothetical protein
MGKRYFTESWTMNKQNWYLTAVVIIAIIAIGLLPVIFPSESYLKALQQWGF